MRHRCAIRSIVLVWLFLPMRPTPLLATGNAILPGEAQYAALETAENCSATRAVLRHSEADYAEVEAQRQSYKVVLLQRRKQLEMCAEEKGASLGWDPRAQALLAEVCSEQYEAWLYAGAHYRMLHEDTSEALASIRQLIRHAVKQCSALPVPPMPRPDASVTADTAG
jgi:hypothetical protein